MPHRVSPTDRVPGHIDELFAQDKTQPEILEDITRPGAQLLMQAALEAEITEFLRPRPMGAETIPPHATCEYSRIRPPSRSRRRTRTFPPRAGGCGRPAGGPCCSARLGSGHHCGRTFTRVSAVKGLRNLADGHGPRERSVADVPGVDPPADIGREPGDAAVPRLCSGGRLGWQPYSEAVSWSARPLSDVSGSLTSPGSGTTKARLRPRSRWLPTAAACTCGPERRPGRRSGSGTTRR